MITLFKPSHVKLEYCLLPFLVVELTEIEDGVTRVIESAVCSLFTSLFIGLDIIALVFDVGFAFIVVVRVK